MANVVYPKYKAFLLAGLLTGDIKAVMVDLGAYTYANTHEFLADIPAGARIAISGNLAGKGVSGLAAFTSSNCRWDTVTGASVEAVALFIDTGNPATSRLIAFFDSGVTGLPVTPSGASYNGIPDSGGWLVL